MSWPEGSQIGMLLLTGGEGRRFGAPKHLQPHPFGGTWAGHLVGVFEHVFPGAPIQVLGAPIPDRQELGNLVDPRLGPARALAHWAAGSSPFVSRWWVVACDQIRWTVPNLEAWVALALTEDPSGENWVLAEHEGRIQYLGGFLGASLVPGIAATQATSLRELAESLPCRIMASTGAEWLDVDQPEDLVRSPENGPWADVLARTGPRPPG